MIFNNNQVYRLTPVRRPSAVNAGENSYKPRMLWNHSSLASFLSWQLRPMFIQSRMKATTYVRQARRQQSAL